MISPLQLNNYFVKELTFRSNPAYRGKAKPRSEGKIHCTVELGTAKEAPDHFMVLLGIAVEPSQSPPALDPYYINIRVVGLFNFTAENSLPQAEKERMVSLNGCSILMGLARGLVAQATGVSEFGKYLLPPVNFVEVLKGMKHQSTSGIESMSAVTTKARRPTPGTTQQTRRRK